MDKDYKRDKSQLNCVSFQLTAGHNWNGRGSAVLEVSECSHHPANINRPPRASVENTTL